MATAVPPHTAGRQTRYNLHPVTPAGRAAAAACSGGLGRLDAAKACLHDGHAKYACDRSNVSHCIPASMAPWAQRLVIRKKSGNRTGLEITFKERCPTCDKPREEVKATFKRGLTVERDLLPELRKKLGKCCGKVFAAAERNGAFQAMMSTKQAKRRRRETKKEEQERRIKSLEAELASTKNALGHARTTATKLKNTLDFKRVGRRISRRRTKLDGAVPRTRCTRRLRSSRRTSSPLGCARRC